MFTSRAWCALALVFGVLFSPHFLQAEPNVPVPEEIELVLDPEIKLDPAAARLVEEVKRAIQGKIYTYKSIGFEAPETLFPENVTLVPLKPMFLKDAEKDLLAAAFEEVPGVKNPDGTPKLRRKKLSKEQWAELTEHALIVIDSPTWPGQKHKFRQSTFIVKGAERIRIDFRKAKGAALYELVIQIPDRFFDDTFSVRNGIRQIGLAIAKTFGVVFGNITKDRRYSDAEIWAEIHKLQNAFLVKELIALNGGTAPSFRVDLRLYDDKLMGRALPVLQELEQQSHQGMEGVAQEIRARVEAKLKAEKTVPESLWEQIIADEIATARQQKFYALAEKEPRLEKLSVGLGKLLADQGRALEIVFNGERRQQERLETHRTDTIKKLAGEHAVLSTVDEWVRRRAQAAVEAKYQETRTTTYEEIAGELDTAGYPQDAFLLRKTMEFVATKGEEIKAKLELEKVPTDTFQYVYHHWFSRFWEVKQDEQSKKFYAEKTVTAELSTRWFGWRLLKGLHRTGNWAANGFYWTVIRNMLNGPVGLRSLWFTGPYKRRNMVDPDTGAIVPDPSSETQTVWSRIGNIWRWVAENNRKLWAKPDTGQVPKSVERVWNFFWNDALCGFVWGTLLYPTLHVGITLTNTLLSGAIGATNTVWAPAGAMLAYATSATLYDFDAPRKEDRVWLPILNHVVGRGVLCGVGQTLVAGLAPIAHAGYAAGRVTVGWLDKHFQTFGDWLGRGFLVATGSRIPARSTAWLNTYESGPGRGNFYFYEIDPRLVIGATLAQMEMDQLALYELQMTQLLALPEQDYFAAYQQVRKVFQFLGGVGLTVYIDEGTPSLRRIRENMAEHRKALAGILAKRRERIGALSNLANLADRPIKMPKEQLEKSINSVAATAEKFYTTKYFPAFPEATRKDQVAKFWNALKLVDGDWIGFAKQLLVRALGTQILEPAEDIDGKFKVEIDTPELTEAIDRILDGKELRPPMSEVPKYHYERPPTPATARVPQPTAAQICAGHLSTVGNRLLFANATAE